MPDISASGLKPLCANGRALWGGIERVLNATLRTGYTYDLLEAGVYVIAVRNGGEGQFQDNLEAALESRSDDIFWRTPKLRWGSAATSELAYRPPAVHWFPRRFSGESRRTSLRGS